MFNSKTIRPLKTHKKRIRICNFKQMDNKTNELLLDYSTPKYMQNLHLDNGKLTSGLGLQSAEISFKSTVSFKLPNLPTGVTAEQLFVYYRYDRVLNIADNRLIIRSSTGEFYEASISKPSKEFNLIPTIKSQVDVFAINYRYNNEDLIMFCSKNLNLTVYNGSAINVISEAPQITSITAHYNRVFVSTYGEGDVWFSDDYNPFNWNVSLNEAGYIKFSDKLGKTLKVLSYNDYVYIFREHGIYRLNAIGDQKDFELVKVLEINGKIYANSICQVMDKIVFVTNVGMMIFDGYTAKLIQTNNLETTKILDEKLVASNFNNYYILAYIGTNFDAGDCANKNNRVLVYDTLKDILEINKGISILDIVPIRVNNTSNNLVLLNNNTSSKIYMLNFDGKVDNKGLMYRFETVNSYLSNLDKIKYIRNVKIFSKYDTTLTINIDGIKYEYNVKGSNSFTTVKVMKKGKLFGFSLSGTCSAEISGLEIQFDEVV